MAVKEVDSIFFASSGNGVWVGSEAETLELGIIEHIPLDVVIRS